MASVAKAVNYWYVGLLIPAFVVHICKAAAHSAMAQFEARLIYPLRCS